jgi:2-polyprenyl-3-methyl-5-hydroxy-6-metoxy-1,4-benzoquinol methylase
MKISASVYQKSQHLGENQLYPPEMACLFCGSQNRYPIYLLQKKPDIFLLKCENCKAASASRLPTKDTLDRYYRNYYSTPYFIGKKEKVACDNVHEFSFNIAKKILKYIDKASAINILDFGGGDGSITLKIAEQLIFENCPKISITVVDYNKILAITNDPRISIECQRDIDSLSPGSADFVMMNAVIEHIPHPKEVIDRLTTVLKEGGIIYFRTPFIEPFLKIFDLFKIHLLDFTFPAHIHDLGMDFWETGFVKLMYPNNYSILLSNPSGIDSTFRKNIIRTLAACIVKSPWYLFGNSYKYVGGWEVLLVKKQ